VIWKGATIPQTFHWLKWGAHIRPQNYRFPWTETQISTSFLDPSDLPSKPHTGTYPISHFATMHQTDKQTSNISSNRWLKEMFDDYRPLSLYRECRRPQRRVGMAAMMRPVSERRKELHQTEGHHRLTVIEHAVDKHQQRRRQRDLRRLLVVE